MPETQREKITKQVLEILENYPNGIRYTDLFRKLLEQSPSINQNALTGALHFCLQNNRQIERPERGLWILQKYRLVNKPLQRDINEVHRETRLPGEETFYRPFAEYLKDNLGECTNIIPLGGNKFGDRWGTPDVFGVYKFSEADAVRPPVEIISAEIKTDTNQLITAFGQACAYKIFSHKVYLAVPKNAEKDEDRVESLCARFGIGLILFNQNDSQDPSWEIRRRAVKSQPDYFYVNYYLQKLGDGRILLF